MDLTKVQGSGNIGARLVQRIKNANTAPSHHLLMGHTKCGKTTLLNRTRHLLEQEGYVTVFFDIAEEAGRAFEYTTLLLMMAGQVTQQLAARAPKIAIKGATVDQLLQFLQEREITLGGKNAGDVTGKADAKVGWLMRFLGEVGLGLELRGGFERSREITMKIEADTDGFLKAVTHWCMTPKRRLVPPRTKA